LTLYALLLQVLPFVANYAVFLAFDPFWIFSSHLLDLRCYVVNNSFAAKHSLFFGIIWEEKYIILTILDIDAKLLGRIIITTSEYHP